MRCSGASTGLALIFAAVACGRPPGPGPKKVGDVTCPDGTLRAEIDCSNDLGLKEKVVDANASLGQIGLGIGARYEERAVGQVTDSTYQLALRLESLCSEYNACVMTSEQYMAEARQIRTQLDQHVDLVANLEQEPQAQVGDEIWANARPDLAAQRLSLRYALQAIPAGGQPYNHVDGSPLRSGDAFRVVVEANQPAHVYILLMSSQGEPSVLFPMPEMGLRNPIPGGEMVAIPDDGTFELDAVAGEESLQILASAKPLTDIEQRLAALRNDAAAGKSESGKGLLSRVGELVCDAAGTKRGVKYTKSVAECGGHKTRGVVYRRKQDDTDRIVTNPGDDVIVLQHRIDHR